MNRPKSGGALSFEASAPVGKAVGLPRLRDNQSNTAVKSEQSSLDFPGKNAHNMVRIWKCTQGGGYMDRRKLKRIAVIAMMIALYFVLSAMLKIPIAGHITLDLGYIVLMVAAMQFGAVPAMIVGGAGAFLESALMSQRGVSPGWIVMNLIAGGLVGWVLYKADTENRKKLVIKAVVTVLTALLLGAGAKMLIDCAMYSLPVALKIPTTVAAWLSDSLVMLVIGLPLSLALKKRMK